MCTNSFFIHLFLQVVEILEAVESAISNMKKMYEGNQINFQLEKLRLMLEAEKEKLNFKNVKPIENQEDFDKLIDVMKTLLRSMEKFLNTGRDFESAHEYAEEIRKFFEIREKANITEAECLRVEKDEIVKMIRNLSDIFAKKFK